MQCRICLDTDDPESMLSPCECRGSSMYIHRRCLDEYIHYYPNRMCSVCKEPFYIPDPWKIVSLVIFIVLLTYVIYHVNILWGFKLLIGFAMYVFVSMAQRFLTTRTCLVLSTTLILGCFHPMWLIGAIWMFLVWFFTTHEGPMIIILFVGWYMCMFIMAVATIIDPYLAVLVFVPVETLMLTIF